MRRRLSDKLLPKTLLYQPLDGYCYNSDTLCLYAFAKLFIKKQASLLEVGSGCGVLGILLAKALPIALTQIEVQELFFFLTTKNCENNGIQSNVILGDFLIEKYADKYDYIVSNPPFYHSGVVKARSEHKNICKINSYLPMESFFKKVSQCLTPKGEFIFCYDASQITQILTTLNDHKLGVEHLQFVYPKPNTNASLVLVRAKKSSQSLAKILPSLVAINENNEPTKTMQKIYTQSNTNTIKCTL